MTKIDKELAEQLFDPKRKARRSMKAAVKDRVTKVKKNIKRKSSWLDFVKANKHMRTATGALDLKAISKLYKSKGKGVGKAKAKVKTYDPSSMRGPPEAWFAAMKKGIEARSDVRNPAKVVKQLWAALSTTARQRIAQRAAANKPFSYDLPLPDDRRTKGTGTVRMVKPFNLAEVQVNLSPKDFLAALKSGIFSKMRRNDGTTALVARCKSKSKNANIFVDKAR